MIVILDYGSQYSMLIARRLRGAGISAQILPYDATIEQIQRMAPDGIIISGGPNSVYADDALECNEGIFTLGLPILALCYGHQLLATRFGGRVELAATGEYGATSLQILSNETALFTNIAPQLNVWMSHQDRVSVLPENSILLASSQNCPYAAYAILDRQIYALQFHPESSHTQQGTEILVNFATRICGAERDWNTDEILHKIDEDIKTCVGKGRVIVALSGGVDSSTMALLLHKSLAPDQIINIFVDSGLLRTGEVEEVVAAFKGLDIQCDIVDARNTFLMRLAGVTDPEEKRQIIGNTFIEVFRRHIDTLRGSGPIEYLAQGTIYSDVIESQGSHAAELIKSHHNVGGLPENMELLLVEPLRLLFKDEVRELAATLGLPDNIRLRHPFPGPGLAIRIIGEVTAERLDILRQADAIYLEELRKSGYYQQIWQAFCVLLPIKSVGVVGDKRAYGYTIALRAVASIDGMSAAVSEIPIELLQVIASNIVARVQHVTRVVYDITSKPPGTIEWE